MLLSVRDEHVSQGLQAHHELRAERGVDGVYDHLERLLGDTEVACESSRRIVGVVIVSAIASIASRGRSEHANTPNVSAVATAANAR